MIEKVEYVKGHWFSFTVLNNIMPHRRSKGVSKELKFNVIWYVSIAMIKTYLAQCIRSENLTFVTGFKIFYIKIQVFRRWVLWYVSINIYILKHLEKTETYLIRERNAMSMGINFWNTMHSLTAQYLPTDTRKVITLRLISLHR